MAQLIKNTVLIALTGQKYISRYELQKLLSSLTLSDAITWDWLILLIAKTGMRFSEALAITPKALYFFVSRVLMRIENRFSIFSTI